MNKGLFILIFTCNTVLGQGLIKFNADAFVTDFDISPEGNSIALVYEKSVEIKNLKTYESLASIADDKFSDLAKVLFINDKISLIIVSKKGEIYSFDQPSKELKKIFQSDGFITAICSKPETNQIAFGTKSGDLKVIHSDGRLVFETKFETIISDVAFNNDGRLIAACDLDGNVIIKDLTQNFQIVEKFEKDVVGLSFNENGHILLYYSGKAVFYKIINQNLIEFNSLKLEKNLSDFYLMEDDVIACGTYSGILSVVTQFGTYTYRSDFSIKKIIGLINTGNMIRLKVLGYNGEVYTLSATSMTMNR